MCPGEKELALARHNQSEAVKSLGHSSMSDSSLTFSQLVSTLGIANQKQGEDLGLHFNGTMYNAAIHKAAQAVISMSGPANSAEKALKKLELEFGREILSNEYSN